MKNFINRNFQKFSYINLFMIISAANTISFFLWNYLNRGIYYNQLIAGPDCEFSDYFTHIAFASHGSELYSLSFDACFPPWAYCFYYLIWKVFPGNGGALNFQEWEMLKYSDNVLHIFVLYNILTAILLVYTIQSYFDKHGIKYLLVLPTLIMVSCPFFGWALQRGNVIALVAILLALAYNMVDNENRVQKFAAKLLIAVSAGFKAYPAIYGLHFIKSKKYKEAVLLLVMGVLIIFVPFVFWGGKDGLSFLVGWYQQRAVGKPNSLTVRGMTIYWYEKWMLGESNAKSILNTLNISVISVVIETIFFVVSVICFFLSKNKWQQALFLSGILASYIPSNNMYTIVYYLVPLLCFLQEHEIDGLKPVYLFDTVCFAMIFSIPFYLSYHDKIAINLFMISYLLLFVNTVDVIFHSIKRRKPAVE